MPTAAPVAMGLLSHLVSQLRLGYVSTSTPVLHCCGLLNHCMCVLRCSFVRMLPSGCPGLSGELCICCQQGVVTTKSEVLGAGGLDWSA